MADGEACSLVEKDCVPCRGGVPPMGVEEIADYLPQLDPGWSINEAGHLERQLPARHGPVRLHARLAERKFQQGQ